MSRQIIKTLTPVRIGAFLALLLVAFQPNFGIVKYGPSPALPAFFLFVLGLWFIWRERAELFTAPAQRRWLMVFLLLFVPVVASVPGSFNLRTSFNVAVVLFLYFFAGVALLRALREDSERIWLIKWVSLVLLFWVADSILQMALGHDLFGVARANDGRVIGPFADNLHMSTLLVLLLPMLLMWVQNRGLFLTLVAFAITGGIALLGGSRAALFFLAIVAAGLFFHLPGGRGKWLAMVAVIVTGTITVGLSPVLQERFARFEVLRAPTFEKLDQLLTHRLFIWDAAVNMVRDRPTTGVGAGAFQAAYEHYSTRPDDVYVQGSSRAYHAHQLYIGIGAETGLTGLTTLLVALGLCIRWYWQAAHEQRIRAWPFALGLLVYSFPINSQLPLFTQWLFPVILLLLAGMLAALDENRTAGAPPASRV